MNSVVAGFVLLSISSATFFAEHKIILVQQILPIKAYENLLIESYVKVRG